MLKAVDRVGTTPVKIELKIEGTNTFLLYIIFALFSLLFNTCTFSSIRVDTKV